MLICLASHLPHNYMMLGVGGVTGKLSGQHIPYCPILVVYSLSLSLSLDVLSNDEENLKLR